MKRFIANFFVLSILIGIGFPLKAQVKNDDVLLTIGGKPVTVGEFMAVYQKNDMKKGDPIDTKKLEDYLTLYINFKLKVREAEELGLDTVTSFVNELKGYRDQLAKPYFTDEATIGRLIREAYDREHFDLRTRHIFVKLAPDALPKDTLEAWQKISKIRERLMNGEAFEKVAAEVSEDPSVRDREANQQHPFLPGNHGDLGYFTVFDYVYSFESGAYNTEPGKVSPIVRTEYGYHLIKVTTKQEALGKVTAAHIYMSIPKNASHADSLRVSQRIDSVYHKLKDGAKWEEMVKQYSDDKGSAAKGGVLPKFGVNRMVPEFIDAIYKLAKEGDFSTPVQTPYGWHIIRLIEIFEAGSIFCSPRPHFLVGQVEEENPVAVFVHEVFKIGIFHFQAGVFIFYQIFIEKLLVRLIHKECDLLFFHLMLILCQVACKVLLGVTLVVDLEHRFGKVLRLGDIPFPCENTIGDHGIKVFYRIRHFHKIALFLNHGEHRLLCQI